MMTYFEIRDRLNGLVEFRSLYREFLDFTNRANNLPAQAIGSRMEPMLTHTVDSLHRVGLGALVTSDAPARGGRKVRINLIRAIFRDRVREHFSLDDRAPLKILDQAIVAYRERLWRAQLQLGNPLFWLAQFAGFLADLPLIILHRSGFNTAPIESRTPVRLYRLAVQTLILVLACYLALERILPAPLIAFDILP